MKHMQKWVGGLSAIALTSFLTACGAEEPQAEAPVAAAPAQTELAPAESASAETRPMPEGLEISGRFADMFITDITDDFNPGLQIGDQFPAIRALYEGEEVMSIDRFIRDKGAIFIAMRSADW